ncbi:MAG: Fic family protein [Gammaproteobacteria bacterium]|jgi:Fic family protein|nr:Fic family protein [Gammaproteobacteria bacterium]MDH3863731.1 Fic family protein [Gammaproteobacteria bacterium]MDH3904341.1 Fic family protein [Gammaproteobacteria bacterium]
MPEFDPKLPYNDLPPLPPPDELIETKAILKQCIAARVALAELKQAAELIPNSAVLVNALPLLEARASSEIENIVTTTDKLFEFADVAEDKADAATKEALRYRTALYEGTKMVQRRMLTTDMAIQIVSIVKGVELDLRAESGTKLKNRASGEVIYTPPVGQKRLQKMLDNWAEFMQKSTDIDPLVRMAVQHYQFEAIHPFADGNGRTGRILNIVFLVEQGLLDSPILYLSRFIISNKAAYYLLLKDVTHNQQWEPWIKFILEGVEETCVWTTDKIKAIRELMVHTAKYVQQNLPKIYSWELVELLFRQPYCRIGNLVDTDIAKRQTASVYLKQLCDLGVLKEVKSGRENIFVHPKYIELLTGEENVWIYYADIDDDDEDIPD